MTSRTLDSVEPTIEEMRELERMVAMIAFDALTGIMPPDFDEQDLARLVIYRRAIKAGFYTERKA